MFKDLKWPAIMGSLRYKVVRPDMIGVLKSMSHTGLISEPKSCSLGLFLWYLETFFSPDRVNFVFTNLPTFHI